MEEGALVAPEVTSETFERPFLETLKVLNQLEIPYVVAGGFAVVMHGSNRLTPDLNIALDYRSPLVGDLVDALAEKGFVGLDDCETKSLPDPQKRLHWINDCGQRFLSFEDPHISNFRVELFLEAPIDFDQLKEQALTLSIEHEQVVVASCEHLRQMKVAAARAQDLADLRELEITCRHKHGGCVESEWKAVLADPPAGFDTERLENLRSFAQLSPTEKLRWLEELLDQLSKYCVFR